MEAKGPLGFCSASLLLLLLSMMKCSWSFTSVESTDCELTTGRTLTVIKSVRFPEPYGPNVNCRYAVKKRSESICSVTFLFNVLDLQPSPNCSNDYLRFEGSGEKLCGSKPVGFSRTVSFVDSSVAKKEIVMTFHSGNKTRGGLGYMITVVQQECPRPSCDIVHDEVDFSMSSPNYPLPYDNQRLCRYSVHKTGPTICRLSLTVHTFELEEDDHCDADYLQLPDGNKLCGTLKTGQIIEVDFPNGTMTMEFQSDHLATKNGFQLFAHQVECPLSTEENVNQSTQATETDLTTTDDTTTIVNTTVTSQDIITAIP